MTPSPLPRVLFPEIYLRVRVRSQSQNVRLRIPLHEHPSHAVDSRERFERSFLQRLAVPAPFRRNRGTIAADMNLSSVLRCWSSKLALTVCQDARKHLTELFEILCWFVALVHDENSNH